MTKTLGRLCPTCPAGPHLSVGPPHGVRGSCNVPATHGSGLALAGLCDVALGLTCPAVHGVGPALLAALARPATALAV